MTTTPAAKTYQRGRDVFFFIDLFLNCSLLIIFMGSGLSVLLRDWATHLTAYPVVINAIYFSVFYWAGFTLFLPINFWEGFIWEHKFNLSTQSPGSWLADHFKKSGLGFLLAILLLEVIYFLLGRFQTTCWIWAGFFCLFVTVILTRIMPNVVIPLFYKYSQLEDQTLRDRILEIFQKCRMKISDVYLIDLSKKTKKANAFICGLGRSRRIVLSDTLVANYTVPEIEAVVAHEIGHHKHQDIWRFFVVNALITFLGFFIADRFLKYALVRFGLSRMADIAFFPVLIFGMIFLNLLTMPFLNAFSRWMEVRADQFSLNVTQNPESFISMIKKLGLQNFTEFEPHWLKELVFYDHPSIAKRIRLAQAAAKPVL